MKKVLALERNDMAAKFRVISLLQIAFVSEAVIFLTTTYYFQSLRFLLVKKIDKWVCGVSKDVQPFSAHFKD